MTQRWMCALCTAILLASPLYAQNSGGAASPTPPRLTLPAALARALANNPTLRAAREHVSATEAQRITAGLRVNPTLTLLGQQVTLPANNPDGNPYYYSANVSRLFERGQKRRWRLEGASATAEQTASQELDVERQIILQVRQAFTAMLLAKGGRAIADENLSDYRRTLELSKARLDAGDITRTDYERIDLQLAQFESDADNALLSLQQAGEQLQVLLGATRPDLNLDVAGDLAPPTLPVTEEEAERRALVTRPDLQAAERGLRAAEAGARYAIASGTADPIVATEYERSGADNTVGASISIPLRIFDRNQGEKERTRFEVRSSQFALEAARNGVVSDVAQAWAAYSVASRLADRYRSHYLDEAGRVRDNLQFSYRNGNSTLLDYLDALREYRAISLLSLNANAQVWLAIHQLSFVTATDILP